MLPRNAWRKRKQTERRARGVCIVCEAPCAPFKKCFGCRADQSVIAKRFYQRRITERVRLDEDAAR